MPEPDYSKMTQIDGILYRSFTVDRKQVNEEERSLEISFSSEEPIEQFFGMEILGHKKKNVLLDRLNDGGPVLVDHFSDQAGVVEKAWIDTEEKKGRAVLRFSRSAFGAMILDDIKDGIRRNVSVGYRVHSMVMEKKVNNIPFFRAETWEPMEISIVSVPSDPTIGVGRSNLPIPRFQEAVGGGRTQSQAPIVVQINHREGVMEQKELENKDQKEVGGTKEVRIDVDAVRNEAVKQEQERSRELLALGSQHHCEEEARQHVAGGKTVEELKHCILKRYQDVKPTSQLDPKIGLTDKERKSFSFIRMISALAAKDWDLAPFEYECSRATAKRIGREPQGMFIPEDVLGTSIAESIDTRSQMDLIQRSLLMLLQKRELTVGTAATAGNLVGTNLLSANFIELLRNFQVLRAVGAQILSGLVGDVTFPRQDGGASGGWLAESANAANSELTTDLPALTPHSVGAYSDMTRKLLLQSSPSVEALVRADLAMAIALEVDSSGLNGTGAGDIPKGIRATTGIGDVDHGTDGSLETWAKLVEYESDVAVGNAAVGDMWYIMNAKAFGSAKVIPKVTAQAIFLASGRQAPLGSGEANGYPVAVTNQLPSNLTKGSSTTICSATVFGNFRDLIIGEWSGIDILADPFTLGLDGGLRVIAHQDVDYLVRHPASFSASDDVLTA